MDRRHFTALSTATALSLGGLLAPAVAHAQGGPIEGKQYLRLQRRQPTQDPKRIEVVEFFWYGCSHCHDFEPTLDAWARKLPADVNFRRMPVAFREVPFVLHQKLYFALEAMGLVDRLHRQVFNAMHVERLPLSTPDQVADFAARNGVDRAKFLEQLNSFSVATQARQAAALAAGYQIDGTPAMGIGGRYFCSGPMTGGNERMLAVTDALVDKLRKGG